MPARRGWQFGLAYLVGTEPALVRLQFLPVAAGQTVIVQPGPGVTIDPPATELLIGPTGECVVSVALNGNFRQSDLTVDYVGVKTRLPLVRTPAQPIAAGAADTARRR